MTIRFDHTQEQNIPTQKSIEYWRTWGVEERQKYMTLNVEDIAEEMNVDTNDLANADDLDAVLFRLQEICSMYSHTQGFWDDPARCSPEAKLALLHSEVSEMFDGFARPRASEKLGPEFSQVEEEAADVLLVLCSICSRYNINLAQAVDAKLQHNATRLKRLNGKQYG